MADGALWLFIALFMVQKSECTVPEGGGFIVLAEPPDSYRTANLSGTVSQIRSWPFSLDKVKKYDPGDSVIHLMQPSVAMQSALVSIIEVQRKPDNYECYMSSKLIPHLEVDVLQPWMRYMRVISDVYFRFARTVITTAIEGGAILEKSQEVSFNVLLPTNAHIVSFVMQRDGITYRAKLQERATAEKIYVGAVGSGRTAAFIAFRNRNLLNINLNIEPMKVVRFFLTYEELLQRSDGKYRHITTITSRQVIRNLLVRVHIKEPRPIRAVSTTPKIAEGKTAYTPATHTANATCASGSPVRRWINTPIKYLSRYKRCTENQLDPIFYSSPTEITIEFPPKSSHPQGALDTREQFEVSYDVERNGTGGDILVKDGYFVHFFGPDEKLLPKHIVFVLDISGSMVVKKLQQLKDAMMMILNYLRPVDYFNIILFNDRVKTLNLDENGSDLVSEDNDQKSPEEIKLRWTEHDLTRVLPGSIVSPESIKVAKTRLSYMQAGGATNTFGALRQAVLTAKKQQDYFQTERKDERWKSVIICLTDGEATVGEIRHAYIVRGIAELNTAPQVPIYSVSFGKGENMEFLTNLSSANSGFTRLIREGSNAKTQLEKIFEDITTEPLTNIKFKYSPKQVDVNSTTKQNYPKLLDNEELIVVGHVAERNKRQQISAKVHAVSKDGTNRTFHATSLPYADPKIHVRFHNDMMPSKTRPTTFVERAWAFLTIKQLIEQSKGLLPKTDPHPAQTARRLAEEYSFLTELTSLVASDSHNRKIVSHAKIDMLATQPEMPLISYAVDPPNALNTTDNPQEKVNWLIPAEELSNHSLEYNGKMVCFLPPIVIPYLDIISLRPWIHYVHVITDISFLYARTLVTAEIEGNEVLHKSEEVSFNIVVPPNAYVTGFVLEVEGVAYKALIKEKTATEKTKRNAAIEAGQTGAYLSFRESNILKVHVNIEPTKMVKFFLTYEELLQRDEGRYHHITTVTSEEIVPRMRVKVHIHEPRTIKDLNVIPRMYDDKNINNCPGRSTDTSCKSASRQKRSGRMKVPFLPKSKHRNRKDTIHGSISTISPNEIIVDFPPPDSTTHGGEGKCLGGQLEVTYDVERCLPGSEILIRDGYFVHSFAPEEKGLPKHLIFVLDVSGSMAAQKLQRLKNAVITILNSLDREDYFNIIFFKSKSEMFNMERSIARTNGLLMGTEASAENVHKAIELLNDMDINGDLKLYAALRQAVLTSKRQQSFLKGERKNDRWKPVIMLLTHGEAFEGETLTPDFIIRDIAQLNTAPQTPIYSFSLAEDGTVDYLTNLSLSNAGLARFIYDGPETSAQLVDVYNDVSNERLINVTFRYLPEQVDLTSTTKLHYKTYLHGGELVVAGRVAKRARPISAEVSSVSFDTNKIYITTSPAYEEPEFLTTRFPEALIPTGGRLAPPFERMWAFLKIKQLIEQYKIWSDSASAQRALQLAKEYSFVTELTSLVVVNPGDTENDIPPTAAPVEPPSPLKPPVESPDDINIEVTTRAAPTATEAAAATEEINETTQTTQQIPLEATTINPLEKVNISQVTWLPPEALTTGTVELDVFGDKMRYFLCVNTSNSSNLTECSAPGISLGKCRHLTQCAMRVITDSVQAFIPYQCQRDNYLAVCCVD